MSCIDWRIAGLTLAGLTLALAAPLPAVAGSVPYGSGDDAGHAYNPVWSQDGRYLAFEANHLVGDVQLYVSEVEGASAKRALEVSIPGGSNPFGGGGQVLINPTWHPDVLVFEAANAGGQYRLFYYQPGGGVAPELISAAEIGGNLSSPFMSGNGQSLAFVSSISGSGDLYRRETSSASVEQLTKSDGSESFPSFSKDGSRVVFARKDGEAETIVELIVSSGEETVVAEGAGARSRPIYAGDGSIVYFASAQGDSRWNIVVHPIGGKARTVAKDIRLPLRARPALDPSGGWIAYTSSDPARAKGVELVRVDGSKTVTIATAYEACGEPAVTRRAGKTMLAFTALPASGADWRSLYVVDITSKL